jgi:hypothetical protein
MFRTGACATEAVERALATAVDADTPGRSFLTPELLPKASLERSEVAVHSVASRSPGSLWQPALPRA